MTDIKTVIDNFEFKGNFVDVAEYGSGHINKTYLVTFDNNGVEQKYILQQLNANVFKNIAQLMKNVFAVTSSFRYQGKRRRPGQRNFALYSHKRRQRVLL